MNYRILARVLGLLLLLVSAAMLACEIYGFVIRTDEEDWTAHALFKSFVITFGVGLALTIIGHKSGREILRKEGIAIVGLGWLTCALFGSMPYMLTNPSMDFPSAFFESMSGFTTVGASVIADLEHYPKPIMLWRGLTQWLGGMGILVLFVALLSYLGVGSKSLIRHESSAQLGYGLHARIRQTALLLWQIYLALSAISAIGLYLLGMSAFDAVLHTFSAISTGGFSQHNASVAYFDSAAIDAWLCVIMILGGTNFLLMAMFLRRQFDRVKADEEFRLFISILVTVTAIISIDLMAVEGMTVGRSLQLASFQVVSIMTTTGFVTDNYDLWPTMSKTLLVAVMFIGGCAGSTSGGIKVTRILVLFKSTGQQLINSFRPNQMIPVKVSGSVLSEEHKNAALFFIALMGGITILGTIVVGILEPDLDMISGTAAVIATLYNIGPGLGAVGPATTYADLMGGTKIFLAIMMALGRLEVFAILVLFLPSLWRRY